MIAAMESVAAHIWGNTPPSKSSPSKEATNGKIVDVTCKQLDSLQPYMTSYQK